LHFELIIEPLFQQFQILLLVALLILLHELRHFFLPEPLLKPQVLSVVDTVADLQLVFAFIILQHFLEVLEHGAASLRTSLILNYIHFILLALS